MSPVKFVTGGECFRRLEHQDRPSSRRWLVLRPFWNNKGVTFPELDRCFGSVNISERQAELTIKDEEELISVGAKLYELGTDGVSEEDYDDIDGVMLWRNFLAAPERVFHQLFKDEE